MIRRRSTLAWVTAALLAFGATSARANIIIQLGNNPQPDEANVLLTNQESGTTITGTTNTNPPVSVDISSSQNLFQQGGGQANVIATSTLGDPTTHIGFTDFAIGLTPGQTQTTFQDLIFNADVASAGGGQPGTGGTATISVTDNLGNVFAAQQTIGVGQNFFTIIATNGESIQSVSLTMDTGDFTSLNQVRISGVGTPIVPEPSTLLMGSLAVVGGAGYRWQRRRRAD